MIKEHFYRQNEKFTKLQKQIELFEKMDSMEIQSSREPIPESIRFVVWRRDEGKCVKCGSNKSLEFDHIIPFSKGGSNTERNLQLLCEKCNREKSSKI
jgi:5-methylcytosine-specific restriction endonuclease McrA